MICTLPCATLIDSPAVSISSSSPQGYWVIVPSEYAAVVAVNLIEWEPIKLDPKLSPSHTKYGLCATELDFWNKILPKMSNTNEVNDISLCPPLKSKICRKNCICLSTLYIMPSLMLINIYSINYQSDVVARGHNCKISPVSLLCNISHENNQAFPK